MEMHHADSGGTGYESDAHCDLHHSSCMLLIVNQMAWRRFRVGRQGYAFFKAEQVYTNEYLQNLHGMDDEERDVIQ